MVVEDDPGVDFQALLRAAVVEGAHEDVAARCGGEDGEPLDDGGGDEGCVPRLVDAGAAAHGGSVMKQSFGDKGVPKLELGNEGEAPHYERG